MALVVCGLYHGLFWGRMSDINIFAFFFFWLGGGWARLLKEESSNVLPGS